MLWLGPLFITSFFVAHLTFGFGVALQLGALAVFWFFHILSNYFTNKKKNISGGWQHFYNQFDQMQEASRLIYGQSEQLQKIVATEVQAVQSSAAAVDEISSMLNRTVEATQNLVSLSQGSREGIQSASNKVTHLNELMSQVHQDSETMQESTMKKLSELREVSESMSLIRSKTSVINEIVFQTKLLSFNASVEAARAGEAGKGFAVVADEMGKLARHSGQAAIEIEKIVTESIQKTEQRFKEVTETLSQIASHTSEQLTEASQHTQEVTQEIENLAQSFDQVDEMSQHISEAAREQEVGVKSISQSLHQLSENSTLLGKVSQTTLNAAVDLAKQTEESEKNFLNLSSIYKAVVFKIPKPFNFKAATQAHMDWKMKLTRYLQSPDKSLNPDHVCLDNQCVLGKWIYGDGKVYHEIQPEMYENLRGSHAQFHKTAGEIIRLAHLNEMQKAQGLLMGPYIEVSDKTISLIEQMEQATKDALPGNLSESIKKQKAA